MTDMTFPTPPRTFARSATLALAAALLLAVPANAQDGVAGTWMFSIESPDMGTIEVPFTFEQDGTEVTGTVDLSAIPEVETVEISDGEFEDGVLFFLLHVGSQGSWTTVEIEADVEGDEMEGEVYVAEMAQYSPFTATRGG